MTTIAKFLLARIAEDERVALYAQTRDDLQPEDWAGWWLGHYQHYSRHDPARVLAECGAKRYILEAHSQMGLKHYCPPVGGVSSVVTVENCPTLRALASVYADHPDYHEEWKP